MEIDKKIEIFIDRNELLIRIISITIITLSCTYIYYALITMWGFF